MISFPQEQRHLHFVLPSLSNNSFNTALIPCDEHVRWFHNILKDKNVVFCILVSDNQDVGQIRIKICNKIGEVSYSIAREFRGKGFGKIILELAEDEVKGVVKQLTARVKKDNFKSQYLFKLLGYRETENVGYFVYKKELG